MQIMPNPHNPEYSVLYINTNNKELYCKNLFTRNLILPTYANGYHPYLNCEALIFSEGKYYSIYETNSEIELI